MSTVDAADDSVDTDDQSRSAVSRSRPPRPGDSSSAAARNSGVAGGTGSAAGVKEGATTDQEESSGGQRQRGRPTSAQSAKSSSKMEEELSVLRIGGGVTGGEGAPSGGEAPGGGLLLDGGDHRGRQDSSRSPLPHENAAGGEDDASVLDTPLQDKVRSCSTLFVFSLLLPSPKGGSLFWLVWSAKLQRRRVSRLQSSFCPSVLPPRDSMGVFLPGVLNPTVLWVLRLS